MKGKGRLEPAMTFEVNNCAFGRSLIGHKLVGKVMGRLDR